MTICRTFLARVAGVLIGLTVLSALPAQMVWAKPPSVTGVFPRGVQQGQAVTIQATGEFPSWPVQVWSHPAGLTIEPTEDKGTFQASAADDATVGVYMLRFWNEHGATSGFPFLVGSLPEVNEVEPNDVPSQPQAVSLPCVVNGTLAKRGDVDTFAFPLRKGETLVAAVEAHRPLGSPMDAVVQIVSSDGFVLKHVDDGVGLDPLADWSAPADGTYLVRIFAFPEAPNSTIGFAGDAAFVYRLTLTTGPYVRHTEPLAIPAATGGRVSLHGWNLPNEVGPTDIPAAHATSTVFLATSLPGRPSVLMLPQEVLNEKEVAERILNPSQSVTISGLIDSPGDEDRYRVQVKKGQPMELTVQSRDIGHRLDPVLSVIDSKGKSLVQQDDTGRTSLDVQTNLTAPSDDTLEIVLRDRAGDGGWQYPYLLTIREPQGDFSATVAEDHFTLAESQSLDIAITVTRLHKFGDEIVFRLRDVPQGVEVEPMRSLAEGPTATKVMLKLTRAEAVPYHGPIQIEAVSTGEPSQVRPVLCALPGGQTTEQLWLTVPKTMEDSDSN
jgi:hypothetical protein